LGCATIRHALSLVGRNGQSGPLSAHESVSIGDAADLAGDSEGVSRQCNGTTSRCWSFWRIGVPKPLISADGLPRNRATSRRKNTRAHDKQMRYRLRPASKSRRPCRAGAHALIDATEWRGQSTGSPTDPDRLVGDRATPTPQFTIAIPGTGSTTVIMPQSGVHVY
jgi:hypothetical protein